MFQYGQASAPAAKRYVGRQYEQKMNRVVHFEIHAEDSQRAQNFYSRVFGWKFTKWNGPVDYWSIETGPKDQPGIDGGLVMRRGPIDGQAIIAYVCTTQVDNLDQTVKSAVEAGAGIALPKMPIPGIGWLAYLKDTEGNIFGIMQADPSAG
jgi:predicted enzyme related to lactoylglutathione lyase